ATLIGGEHYAVYNMNARKDNLADSITEAFGVIGDTFVKNGYDVGYFMSVFPKQIQDIHQYNNNIFATKNINLYMDYYLTHHPEDTIAFKHAYNGSNATYKYLLSYGTFRFSPEVLRARVYKNGRWLKYKMENYKVRTSLPRTSSFYAFTHLHNTESKKPTFKFLHSLITHFPNAVYYNGTTCRFQSKKNGFVNKSAWREYPHKEIMAHDDNLGQDFYFDQHYDSEACALNYLSTFIQWLKDNEIYDNTQIFVVSDHSSFDSIGIPNTITSKYGRPDVLFLFKDFHVNGELSIDSRLMTNYDSPSIFCENLPNGCPNVPENILRYYSNEREVVATMPSSPNPADHKKNEWIIDHYFQVKGNIYDENSWQDITKEVKNGTFKIDGIRH
ncbi:MAG: hypothetical protein SPJ16_05830, partial [Helicobacter sp.]|nr:hypothetical protein [Helicobacter sp.]